MKSWQSHTRSQETLRHKQTKTRRKTKQTKKIYPPKKGTINPSHSPLSLFCIVNLFLVYIQYFYSPASYTSLSVCVFRRGCKKGPHSQRGQLSPSQGGSNQTQTSKWWVSPSSLPIRPEPVSGGWFFCPIHTTTSGLGFPTENPHGWVGKAGIMRHCGDNKGICLCSESHL